VSILIPMNALYASLAAALAVTAVVTAVFLIRTLIQVRRTAREVERLIGKVNVEAEKWGNVTAAMADLAGIVGGSAGRLVSGGVQLLFDVLRRRRERKPAEGGTPHE
jgi:hypothetical protein